RDGYTSVGDGGSVAVVPLPFPSIGTRYDVHLIAFEYQLCAIALQSMPGLLIADGRLRNDVRHIECRLVVGLVRIPVVRRTKMSAVKSRMRIILFLYPIPMTRQFRILTKYILPLVITFPRRTEMPAHPIRRALLRIIRQRILRPDNQELFIFRNTHPPGTGIAHRQVVITGSLSPAPRSTKTKKG